jgi:membrane-associated protease RseP (regulator of RpoE activity)
MRNIPLLHLVLFTLTFITTLAAGAFQQGIDIFDEPARIIEGLPFAGTLMFILLVHELAHFLASKIHNVKASLPYFIPAPTLLGTLGAFIKMESPIYSRKALIDIGASGPVAGFVVSIAACILGLDMSSVIPGSAGEGSLVLGDSLLFSFLSAMTIGDTPDNASLVLHPVAFAGWIGLFITSLNLIPVGQLDGGHIAYAFFGEKHKILSIILVAALAVMGIFFWEGWLVWAVFLIILRIKHPPVYHWETPLDRTRRIVGILSLAIFILTFAPVPFTLL